MLIDRQHPAPLVRQLGLVLAAAAALVGMLGGQLLTAVPASAHATLVKSSPKSGADLAYLSRTVRLTFDDPIGDQGASIVVTGADGTRWTAGATVVNDTLVSAPTRRGAPAGSYTVAYRVVSEDGHPVSGSMQFTVTVGASPSPTPTASPTATPTPTSPATTRAPSPVRTTVTTTVVESRSGTPAATLAIVTASAVVVLAILFTLLIGRHRGRPARRRVRPADAGDDE